MAVQQMSSDPQKLKERLDILVNELSKGKFPTEEQGREFRALRREYTQLLLYGEPKESPLQAHSDQRERKTAE